VADSRPPPFDVIILAGGRGARLGGADKPGLVVGSLTMAATAARAAVTAGARQVILVGPGRPDVAAVTAAAAVPPVTAAAAVPPVTAAAAVPPVTDAAAAPPVTDAAARATAPGAPDTAGAGWAGRLVVTREEPPGAGPVPALRAGLAEVGAPWVAVLAADLPFLGGDQVLSLLTAACDGASAGAVITDELGAVQWLAGCWRTDRLDAALAVYRGSSLRGLLGPLQPALVRDTGPADGPPPWLDCDTPDELAAARGWLAAPAAMPGAADPDAAGPDAAGPEPRRAD
jgi:molybdopterin-guanine dinucleotide biosynthesis protein A